MNPSEHTRKVLESKLLASSWLIKFYEDSVVSSSGRTYQAARFEIPDFVMAVNKRKSDGAIALVKQWRNGARRAFWEFPAGHLEPGESPADCVKREFGEETGFELVNPRLIKTVFPMPARTDQRAHIYFGNVGRKLGRQNLDAGEEGLRVRFAGKDEVLRLLSNNDAASTSALLAYLLAKSLRLL